MPTRCDITLRQSVVVVAFHPYHFDLALGIRKLADVAEKLPMLFFGRPKLRSEKMSPSKIRRLNDAAFSIRMAADARLTSEPRCRSEMIMVSAKIIRHNSLEKVT